MGQYTATRKGFLTCLILFFSAIGRTESFAGELDMDSLPFFAGKLAAGLKSNTSIESLLSKDEFRRLKELIKVRLGITYEQLPFTEPVLIGILLEMNYYRGNMPFFIDEYLFKTAKSKNKIILGIETFDDQMNLFIELSDKDKKDMLLEAINEDSNKTKKMYEDFASAYYDNDLDKISKLIASEMENSKDLESRFLIKRNYYMAEKIGQMTKTHSLFAAVGAAHLPGKEGVIELLKNSGYILRPVKVTRTGIAKKYLNDMTGKSWQTYSPVDGGFSIDIPGEPAPVPVPSKSPDVKAEAFTYNDEGTQTVYVILRFIFSEPLDSAKADSLFENIKQSMDRSGIKITGNVKPIELNGITGKEYFAEMTGYAISGKIFYYGEKMYSLQIITPGKLIDENNSKRFFNSFIINK